MTTKIPDTLRQQWLFFVVVSTAALSGMYLLFREAWRAEPALIWLAAGSAVFTYLAGMVWRALDQNHRPGEQEVLPRLGPGSVLSLARAAIVAALAGFLFVPRPPGILTWLPAILKIVADLTDFFDGIAARLSKHATRLGETLDLNLDGLGVLVVTVLAFEHGAVPWWYLPVGFARYLFIFGLWWRQRRDRPVHELRPSAARRGLAGLQMGFGTAMLFPVFGPPETTVAAALFMLPFLVGFGYDWLQVSGRLQPASERQKRFWAQLWRFASHWLPLGLRAGIVLITLRRFMFAPGIFSAFLGEGAQTISYLEFFFMLFMAFGMAGRPVAVFALLTLGARLQLNPFTVDYFLLITFYIMLLFLGTGKFSLWRPMDRLISRRIGDPD